MKRRINQIWIEAEEWAEGEWDTADGNSDVIVTFENGEKWIASFFTYRNIVSLTEKNKQSGECLNGQYFEASDMILVDTLTRTRIEGVVRHLLDEERFDSVFDQIGD